MPTLVVSTLVMCVAMTTHVVLGDEELLGGLLLGSMLGNNNNRNCVQYGHYCQYNGYPCCQPPGYSKMICRNNMCLQETCQGQGQSCSRNTNFHCCYHQALTCNLGFLGSTGVCVFSGGSGNGGYRMDAVDSSGAAPGMDQQQGTTTQTP